MIERFLVRKRAVVDVWPAIADLLFLFLIILAVKFHNSDRLVGTDKRELASQVIVLKSNNASQRLEIDQLNLAMLVESKNRELANAVNLVQKSLENTPGFNKTDQSFSLSSSALKFEKNSSYFVEGTFNPASVRQFCQNVLVAGRNAGLEPGELLLRVEGHTDSEDCPSATNCNWPLSGARAGAFVKLMKDSSSCPGLSDFFKVEAVGLSDTMPALDSIVAESQRRITLRFLPNYSKILESKR